jgi:putative Ca2+/H+ antiporter (TMEM165/GDT1 family)
MAVWPRYTCAMKWSLILTVFTTVFLAELGDKTQLATLMFSANANANRWNVFIGSALALVLASAIGVLAGALIMRFIDPKTLKIVAGTSFIVIGLWTIFQR